MSTLLGKYLVRATLPYLAFYISILCEPADQMKGGESTMNPSEQLINLSSDLEFKVCSGNLALLHYHSQLSTLGLQVFGAGIRSQGVRPNALSTRKTSIEHNMYPSKSVEDTSNGFQNRTM